MDSPELRSAYESIGAETLSHLSPAQTANIEAAYTTLGQEAYRVACGVFRRYGVHPSQCHIYAEDVEHDVFLAMMEKMAASGRVELTPPTTSSLNVPSYVRRGAQNKAIDTLRKRANRDLSLNKIEEDTPETAEHPRASIAVQETDYAEDAAQQEFIVRTFQAMVQAKKQHFAYIVRLIDIEGHSLNSAAEIIGITPAAAKARHARAALLFKELYARIVSSPAQTPSP